MGVRVAFSKPPGEELTYSLAFVGGFGDAAGFVLASTFTGHVTANWVLAAVSLAERHWLDTVIRLSAVGAFLAGIFVSVACARLVASRQRPLLVAALAGELVLMTVGSLTLASTAAASTEIFVLCLSLALGLQNGAFRRVGGVGIHTPYLTGMLTGLTVTESEQLFSQPPSAARTQDHRARLRYGVWISFFLGAGTGAALTLRFREGGMLAVVLVVIVLLARTLLSRPIVTGKLLGLQGHRVAAEADDLGVPAGKEP